MDFFEILEYLSVPNRDNGREFTNTERIERINSLLWSSRYRRVNPDGLYFLYAPQPLENITNPVLISSHIDCVDEMTRLFSREYSAELLQGTYDNCITNAAVLNLMLSGNLPDNVLVAFTGDEERTSRGAAQLVRYLTKKGKVPAVTIVLDVTDMGWDAKADFTVENNFWDDELGRRIIRAARLCSPNWKFVPSDEEDIPPYVNPPYAIYEEAEADESWEYDEHDWPCFSFCLPICGPMHSSAGVLARKAGALVYIKALRQVATDLARQEL